MAKPSALAQFNLGNIKKANSAMVRRSAGSGKFVPTKEIVVKVGDKSKTISTKVDSSKINEAWAKR